MLRTVLLPSIPEEGSVAPHLFPRTVAAECKEDHCCSVLPRGTSASVGAFPPVTADVHVKQAYLCSVLCLPSFRIS